MKKNAIGHMTAPKESAKTKFQKLELLPRFICLCLAIVLWLLVTNAEKQNAGDERETDSPYDVYDVAEGTP